MKIHLKFLKEFKYLIKKVTVIIGDNDIKTAPCANFKNVYFQKALSQSNGTFDFVLA